MRSLCVFALGAALALPPSLVRAAPVKDPAAVFPENTLAYAEVHDPGKLLQEIDDLFKGSALDNMPDSLIRFRQRRFKGQQPLAGAQDQALMGLSMLLLPEVRREVQRIGGAGIGLTGFDADGRPEYVAVILPGRSTYPGMLLRVFLMMQRTDLVGNVGGVLLYGTSPTGYGSVPATPNGAGQPAARPHRQGGSAGPVFARTSGAILIGTEKAVADAIRRIQGKSPGKPLTELPDFQQARQQAGAAPGVFGFVGIPRAIQAVAHSPMADRQLALIKVLDLEHFRYESLSLTLMNGTLRYRQMLTLDAKNTGPIPSLLPDRAADTALLSFAPRNAMLAAVVSNADGAKRWDAGLKLADQFAQVNGEKDQLPSAHVKAMEGALGIDVGKDILARIANAGIALANPFAKGLGGPASHPPTSVPVLYIIQATDPKAADALVTDVLPRLVMAINHGQESAPSSETVDGQALHRVQFANQTQYYGVHDRVIVMGPDGKLVAAALKSGAAKQGFLAERRVAEVVARAGHPIALFVSQPLPALMSTTIMVRTFEAPSAASPPSLPPPPPEAPPPPPPQQSRVYGKDTVRISMVPPTDDGNDRSGDSMKELRGLLHQFDQMGPFVATIKRTPTQLTFEAEQTGLKPAVARLTDWLLEQAFKGPMRVRPAQRIPVAPPVRPPAGN